jgi:hypothetical protein
LGRFYLECSYSSGNLQSRRGILSITFSGRPRKGFRPILNFIPSETPNRRVSSHRILSMILSGCPRKGFGRILIRISLTLSFGNPQPGGFNSLYPFHDPFGLSEERNQTDSYRDILNPILQKPPTGRFQPFVSFPRPLRVVRRKDSGGFFSGYP